MFLSNILAFIIARWRVILPAVMLGYGVYYVFDLKSDRDFWKGEYNTAVAGINAQNDIQKAKDAERDKYWIQLNRDADAEHKKQLEANNIKSQLDRTKLSNELELKNAQISLLNNRLGAAYQRVQIQSGINTSERISTTREASNTEAERECDSITSYATTLERACAVTTADFNRASQWIEDVCMLHQCGDR